MVASSRMRGNPPNPKRGIVTIKRVLRREAKSAFRAERRRKLLDVLHLLGRTTPSLLI